MSILAILKNDILHALARYVSGAAIVLGVCAWWYFSHARPAPVHQWTMPKVARQVAYIPHVSVSCPKGGVRVLASPAKRLLGLPAAVQADAHKHVAAAITIPPDDHPNTALALYDDQTGQIDMMDRREPLPWLAAEQHGYIGFGTGYLTGHGRVWKITGGEDLVQMKCWHLGLDGTYYSARVGYGGVQLACRW